MTIYDARLPRVWFVTTTFDDLDRRTTTTWTTEVSRRQGDLAFVYPTMDKPVSSPDN